MTGGTSVTGSRAAAHVARARRASAGRRVLDVARDVLLSVAAAGGAICIALVILAIAFHVTLVMFRTGSMAPAIPAGSLAVVRQIPAGEAQVGDVVTVDRPHELPVTHRVVATAGGPGDSTRLTLKGDANPAPDPAPYDVTSVRRVLWSAPGLARVVVWLSHPLVIGALTVAVAALVTWTLWPRRESAAPMDAAQEEQG